MQKIQKLGLFCAALFGVAWGVSTHQGVSAQAIEGPCRRLSLDPRPRWVPQISWSRDGREILAIDVVGGQIHRYLPDGRYVGAIFNPGQGPLEFDHPVGLTTLGDGYMLENSGGKLIWLDSDFHPLRSVVLQRSPSESGPQEIAPNTLIATDDAEVSALAQVRFADTWKVLFGRFGLKPLRVLEIGEEIAYDSPAWDLYLMSSRTLAQVGSSVWALRFDEPSYLLRIKPSIRKLRAFPAGFDRIPRLPESKGPQSTVIRAKALEQSTTPLALYGRGESLFLLTRRRQATGAGTLWQLHRVDPAKDIVTHSIKIPTTAPHIVLAPGPVWWAVLEKQSVTGVGQQEIPSMLLIPTPWIENPAIEELQREGIPNCG